MAPDSCSTQTQKGELALLGKLVAAGLVLYAAVLVARGWLPEVVDEHTALVSVPLQLLFLAGAIWFGHKSRFQWSELGLTTDRWRRALWEGVLFTLPWIVVAVAVKWAAVMWFPEHAGDRIFELGRVVDWHGVGGASMYAGIYLSMIAVQQFVVRGVIQTTLHKRLEVSGGRWVAIAGASALFSILHLHISWVFVAATFVVGLFWGWMYSRHRNLVGVVLSHTLLGLVVFFVVGFDFWR